MYKVYIITTIKFKISKRLWPQPSFSHRKILNTRGQLENENYKKTKTGTTNSQNNQNSDVNAMTEQHVQTYNMGLTGRLSEVN